MKVVVGEGIIEQKHLTGTVRRFPNFLKAYLDFTANQEASEKIHLWTGISIIAAALERKVWFNMEHFLIFPNLYIVIVGRSGIVKKSTATAIGVNLIREFNSIRMLAQRVTDAALAEALRRSGDKFLFNGKEIRQSALYCYSSEFATLVLETHGILVECLTDLFDGHPHDSSKPWIRETKGEGQVRVYGPCVNLLGCTTPSDLKKCIPADRMEAGFASRILFVIEDRPPEKFIAFPEADPKALGMKADLINDLGMIHALTGPMTMTDEAKKFYSEWYQKSKSEFAAKDDARMSGYFGRKDTFVQKLCMIASAVESNSLVIQVQHIHAAISWLEMLEENMFKTFQLAGKNENANLAVEILRFIKTRPEMPEKSITMKFFNNLTLNDLQQTLELLTKMGQIKAWVNGNQTVYKAVTGAPDISGWSMPEEEESLV